MEEELFVQMWCSIVFSVLLFEELPKETVSQLGGAVFFFLIFLLCAVEVMVINVCISVSLPVCGERHGVFVTGGLGGSSGAQGSIRIVIFGLILN